MHWYQPLLVLTLLASRLCFVEDPELVKLVVDLARLVVDLDLVGLVVDVTGGVMVVDIARGRSREAQKNILTWTTRHCNFEIV